MTKQSLSFQFAVLLVACCLSTAVMARPKVEASSGENAASTFRDCADCPEMVAIPAGSFMLDESGTRRTITISQPFAAGKFEVTFDEWDACVAAGGCGDYRPSGEGWGRGQRPVMNISWDDAHQYLQWLSQKTGKTYRLLSEAEWEYAARAGITQEYPRGKAAGSANANCDECGSQSSNAQTMPVGRLKANAYGLHDMHGNVGEWVEGCFGCDCNLHILRGAALGDGTGVARMARSIRDSTSDRSGNAGFRVATSQNIEGNIPERRQASVADERGLFVCSKQVFTCTEPAKETVKTIFADKPVIIEGSHFDTDSAKLKPGADIKLNEVVAFAARHPEATLSVTGHTDSTGSVAWNEQLSAARAESVKTYLVGKGVAAERTSAKGVASTQPVADNETVEGRAQNRRVEINSSIKEEQKIHELTLEKSPCDEPVKEIFKTIFSDKPITIEGTNFDTDSAKLKPEADVKLNEVVAFAAKYPAADLAVTGHTDSSGSVALNETLSAARAESVKAYLVDKGVAAGRITTKGEASTQPVADNKTVEGRAQNRRVEIRSSIREEHEVSVTE